MSTRIDPITKKPEPPDRLFYATGVLLDAQDFEAEQLYHRGRLARALAYTQGVGTVAGLAVAWAPNRKDALDHDIPGTDRVIVEPGIAIDRLGRMIEVPRAACIRLQNWFDAQSTTDLAQSFRHSVHIVPDALTRHVTEGTAWWTVASGTSEEEIDGVVVDVFVRFVACERGKTPAFATGPFDALDAVQPSRLRDGYELTLVPRRATPDDLPVPLPRWTDITGTTPGARRASVQDAILGGWREQSEWNGDGLKHGREQFPAQDPTALFLARLVLPAAMAGTGMRPVRENAGAVVAVDNHHRSFVYPAGALAEALPWSVPAPAPEPAPAPAPEPAPII
jgi:hypothetical protein